MLDSDSLSTTNVNMHSQMIDDNTLTKLTYSWPDLESSDVDIEKNSVQHEICTYLKQRLFKWDDYKLHVPDRIRDENERNKIDTQTFFRFPDFNDELSRIATDANGILFFLFFFVGKPLCGRH